MYTVASPDPNPRGGVNYLTLRVQFYANEWNELTPNPNECNSTPTSGTSGGGVPPKPYIFGKEDNYLTLTSAILW